METTLLEKTLSEKTISKNTLSEKKLSANNVSENEFLANIWNPTILLLLPLETSNVKSEITPPCLAMQFKIYDFKNLNQKVLANTTYKYTYVLKDIS